MFGINNLLPKIRAYVIMHSCDLSKEVVAKLALGAKIDDFASVRLLANRHILFAIGDLREVRIRCKKGNFGP